MAMFEESNIFKEPVEDQEAKATPVPISPTLSQEITETSETTSTSATVKEADVQHPPHNRKLEFVLFQRVADAKTQLEKDAEKLDTLKSYTEFHPSNISAKFDDVKNRTDLAVADIEKFVEFPTVGDIQIAVSKLQFDMLEINALIQSVEDIIRKEVDNQVNSKFDTAMRKEDEMLLKLVLSTRTLGGLLVNNQAVSSLLERAQTVKKMINDVGESLSAFYTTLDSQHCHDVNQEDDLLPLDTKIQRVQQFDVLLTQLSIACEQVPQIVMDAQRFENEQKERERAEQEQKERERAEQEQKERERAEQERKERERAEQERLKQCVKAALDSSEINKAIPLKEIIQNHPPLPPPRLPTLRELMEEELLAAMEVGDTYTVPIIQTSLENWPTDVLDNPPRSMTDTLQMMIQIKQCYDRHDHTGAQSIYRNLFNMRNK